MELKACPFCENDDQDQIDYGGAGHRTYVFCNECGGRGKRALGEVGAAQAWNTRHTSPEVKALVAAMRVAPIKTAMHKWDTIHPTRENPWHAVLIALAPFGEAP